MARLDKSEIKRGMRLVGAPHPAADPQHPGIRKGVFLTSDGPRVELELPPHLKQYAAGVDEIARRLEAVHAALANYEKARKR